jgi:hypothetical protein
LGNISDSKEIISESDDELDSLDIDNSSILNLRDSSGGFRS